MSHLSLMPRVAKLFAPVAALCLAAITNQASAAPIVYGNFPAATVDYIGVQEESSTDPGNGFFGAPTIGGDTMDFNPQAFAANAPNTAIGSADITDSNLQFMIKAHPGKSIGAITFTEAGDTALTGFAPADAFTAVATTLIVEISEVNGLPVSYNVPLAGLSFSPSGGTYQLSVDGAPLPFYQTAWTGSIFLDLGPTIVAENITGAVTKVNVSIDNTLTATASAGASGFIQKKDADGLVITVDTDNIPEPASFVSALSAIALASGMIRRRKSTR
jgi:hypothetical protein